MPAIMQPKLLLTRDIIPQTHSGVLSQFLYRTVSPPSETMRCACPVLSMVGEDTNH